MNRTAGVLAIVFTLGIAADAMAQRRGQRQQQQQQAVPFTTDEMDKLADLLKNCLLYTSPSPRDATLSRMPSSA